MDSGQIQDHNLRFIDWTHEVMFEAKQAFQHRKSPELDELIYQKLMTKLRTIGLSAYNQLGKQVFDCLNDYGRQSPERGLDITICSEVFPLHWEFIYTGSSLDVVDPRLFWGYRHGITRFLIGAKSMPVRLDPRGGFLFSRNSSLDHWSDEMNALRQIASKRELRFDMLDSCLDRMAPEPGVLEIEKRSILIFARGGYSFLHIASHLLPSKVGVLEAYLELSYEGKLNPEKQGENIKIKLMQLNELRQDLPFLTKSLVFLNACRTMINPEHFGQGGSFPKSFLNLGAGAVIATVCDIPNNFAIAFANKFYDFFLGEQNVTASAALQLTRQFFMDRYNNPLGLAYGLYAHNNLMVCWD